MKFTVILCCLAISFSCSDRRQAKQFSQPELILPDELQATLWAESPLLYNPTNMDVDVKGRIWITEAVNYRNYNNDSSGRLQHPQGDRVMILQDTNNDGHADVSKLFVQDSDLIAPLGIGVIGNKVYVSCSPNLIVYTDENWDDKPDRKEMFLTGFGGKDHDHSLHALVGGPDGNLYFNVGNAGPHIVSDKKGWKLRSGSIYTGGSPYNLVNSGNMVSDDGQVYVGGLALRTNSQGYGLRVMGHNFRNSFEITIDSRGDIWQNDNDDEVQTCRTTWLMENGNAGYFSQDGTRTWQADRRSGQDIFTAHWHQDDPGVLPAGDNTGAGSPTGILINEGDGLGENYKGMLLSADAGRNVIFSYRPKRIMSGLTPGIRNNFITSLTKDNSNYVWDDSVANQQKDKWFRPSDLAIGTEGALYIADWYDPVVGGHQSKDSLGYGRIYRITSKKKKYVNPHLNFTTVTGLIEALKNPAINVHHYAFHQLKDKGDSVVGELEKLVNGNDLYHQARAIWLFPYLGYNGKRVLEKLLKHKNENIRIVTYRSIRHAMKNILPYAVLLADDSSAFVRREVALSLRDIPYKKAKPVFLQLIKYFDASDRWNLEALGSALSGNEEDMYKELVKIFNIRTKSPTQWDRKFTGLAWRLHPANSVNDLYRWITSAGISTSDQQMGLTALAFIPTIHAAQAMNKLRNNADKFIADQADYWVSYRAGNDWFGFIRVPENQADIPAGKTSDSLVQAHLKVPKIQDNHPIYTSSEVLKLTIDVKAGRRIFSSACMTCHRVENEGKNIGPDLSGIGKKYDRNDLLNAIINPSEGIVFGYEGWIVTTKNGRSYLGFLIGDGSKAIVIMDLTGKQTVIPVSEIRSRVKQTGSLMPDPSALGLNKQQLADISGYLQSLK